MRLRGSLSRSKAGRQDPRSRRTGRLPLLVHRPRLEPVLQVEDEVRQALCLAPTVVVS